MGTFKVMHLLEEKPTSYSNGLSCEGIFKDIAPVNVLNNTL